MNLLQPNEMIAVTLMAQQWNQIIEVLHGAPYGIAAPLINTIVQQGMASKTQPGPRLVADAEPKAEPSPAAE